MENDYDFRRSVRRQCGRVVKTLIHVGGIAAVALLRVMRIIAYAVADSCTLMLKELRKR